MKTSKQVLLIAGVALCLCVTACKRDEPLGKLSYNEENCGFSVDEPCQTCLEDRCCDEALDCAYNEDCNDFILCAGDCDGDDKSCVKKCIDDWFDGFVDSVYYNLCLNNMCSTSCPEDEGSCGWSYPNDPVCNFCHESNCCEFGVACWANQDCMDLGNCLGGCSGDQTCYSNCYAQYPDGKADDDAYYDCLADHCHVECF